MTTNELLKNVLLSKVEEIIRTLEIRIQFNAQTIVSIDALNLNSQLESIGLLERLESVYANNQRVEKVIKKCNDNIQKLICIRDIGQQADLKVLLYLYSNYERFHPEEFYYIIQAIQEELPNNNYLEDHPTALSDTI
ncbi:MAG: hypothetical protein AAF990_03030 [Bacteroidota bacterium]